MFCRKCGAQLPDDSEFCSKCGSSTRSDESHNNALTPVVLQPNSPLNDMQCRNCMKLLTTKWKRCPYCDTPNPFYISPDPPETVIQPQPQIIIQEREVTKPEETGCATYVGRIVIGLFLLAWLGSMLSQCGV